MACQLPDFTGFAQKQHLAFSPWHLASNAHSHQMLKCQLLNASFCSRTHLPSRSSAESGQQLTISARAETEDDWLSKDRLEVLAKIVGQECPTHTHKPFGKRCPRIKAPWPRPIPAKSFGLLGYYI